MLMTEKMFRNPPFQANLSKLTSHPSVRQRQYFRGSLSATKEGRVNQMLRMKFQWYQALNIAALCVVGLGVISLAFSITDRFGPPAHLLLAAVILVACVAAIRKLGL